MAAPPRFLGWTFFEGRNDKNDDKNSRAKMEGSRFRKFLIFNDPQNQSMNRKRDSRGDKALASKISQLTPRTSVRMPSNSSLHILACTVCTMIFSKNSKTKTLQNAQNAKNACV